jgi:restriction endonuclease S subunit
MGKYVKPQITLSPEIAAKVSPEAIAKHDDILIACSAAGCLGRVACYIDSGIVASTDTHIAIARPNKELILPEYLYSYLKSFQGQVQLRSREKGDWTREKSWFPIN